MLRLRSLLQTPREWTGAELAERLSVSPRTIRNDVDKLRELGYPVLPARLRARVSGLQSIITPVPFASQGPVVDPDVLTAVAAACRATGGWQYRARVTVFAPAAAVSDRIGPYVGTVTAVDDRTCVLDTGSDSMTTMAVYLGFLGWDFRVDTPPELVAEVRALAERYERAARPGRPRSG